jgi:hypothetical protein
MLEEYPGAIREPITERDQTILHIAIAAKCSSFVKELLQWMTPDDLELKDTNGDTALCSICCCFRKCENCRGDGDNEQQFAIDP